jgi:hypothetical protein
MDESFWIAGVRLAGAFHFLTVALAHFTPIPPGWDENLAGLPELHRRFAVAQNVFIGGVMVFAGVISLAFAGDLVGGSAPARILCAGIGLWWLARLVVLFWLRVWPQLKTVPLRIGFVLLHAECTAFAVAYGWLAFRPV